MNFNQWMQKVDEILEDRFFTTSIDLPDMNWADLFENEYSPTEAVDEFTFMFVGELEDYV